MAPNLNVRIKQYLRSHDVSGVTCTAHELLREALSEIRASCPECKGEWEFYHNLRCSRSNGLSGYEYWKKYSRRVFWLVVALAVVCMAFAALNTYLVMVYIKEP